MQASRALQVGAGRGGAAGEGARNSAGPGTGGRPPAAAAAAANAAERCVGPRAYQPADRRGWRRGRLAVAVAAAAAAATRGKELREGGEAG